MTTRRQRLVAEALTALVPRAPFLDAETIRDAAKARHMRRLRPDAAVWLAAIAHIRHQHTDYDALMDDGYDKDAARFFVVDDTNRVLDKWGATRLLDPDAVEEDGTAFADGPSGETPESEDDIG